MLQLAGGVGLGVDIRNFLQFQAALQRQGVVQIAADEEDLLMARQLPSRGLYLRGVGEDMGHLGGQGLDALHHSGVGVEVHGA